MDECEQRRCVDRAVVRVPREAGGTRPIAHLWLRAELVSATIEREVAGTAHRYVFEWDLGPASELGTAEDAMAILQTTPIGSSRSA